MTRLALALIALSLTAAVLYPLAGFLSASFSTLLGAF